ncbi:MAG: biotin carboxyl carrier protein [Candidatus Westeberhardia cardiocondylae]|nr:biotin carboxyl carrier protein [Candidatus Westeberhardia cardiocondylae]
MLYINIYMDILKIKKLIELVEKSNICELEINKGGEYIRINRDKNKFCNSFLHTKNHLSLKNKNSKIFVSSSCSKDNDISYNTEDGNIIRSPMVGTFYRSSYPGSKPFVEVGDKVDIGDTLFIIEAMKTVHSIQSDISGIVKIIFLNDGQPVEFDEPLVLIK